MLYIRLIMANELVKLYKALGKEIQTPEIKGVRKTIQDKLEDQLRDNFLSVMEIGGVIGYDKLEKELERSRELVAQIKKDTKRKKK